ncbi:hypothetical protein [Streptomyces sp. NPDC047097]|uniref:hypothetical protein n=1 Tax=Streptomyces sp. NPDC047097 TaxID=3155260 RepID=UPI0033C3A9AC
MTTPVDYDTLLTRILTEPTTASLLLEEMADQLAKEPHLYVGESTLTWAERWAYTTLCEQFPEAVVEDAADRATQHIPPPHHQETGDTYALRLRLAARGL